MKLLLGVSASIFLTVLLHWPAVGAAVTAKDGQFVGYSDGTVLDNRTKLMWAAQDSGRELSPAEAIQYVKGLVTGGFSDWRLPTAEEISSLYDARKEPRGGAKDSDPMPVATKLIHVTQCCYHISVRPQPGQIFQIGFPFFTFEGGRVMGAVFVGDKSMVLPVRSSQPGRMNR
jgi:hypothetical protein